MNNFYEVYIGNLSVTVSEERLKNLFSEVGEVNRIWINQKYKSVTYGFIEYYHLIEAKKACEQLNNRNLDNFVIRVNLSKRTGQNLNNAVRKKTNDSILLELPKKKGCTKNSLAINALRRTLIENNDIVNDYGKAYFEAENIPFYNRCEVIKTESETPTLSELGTTIERYFKHCPKGNTLKVDFDLSKGKVLTTELYDKFFNFDVNKS